MLLMSVPEVGAASCFLHNNRNLNFIIGTVSYVYSHTLVLFLSMKDSECPFISSHHFLMVSAPKTDGLGDPSCLLSSPEKEANV